MAPIRKQSQSPLPLTLLTPCACANPPASRPGEEQPQTQRDRQQEALLEFRNRRLQRRLDELERTNPTDIPASSFVPPTTSTSTGVGVGVNNQINAAGALTGKKKQSGNVRKILYAKKSLKDWLEELVRPDPHSTFASHSNYDLRIRLSFRSNARARADA